MHDEENTPQRGTTDGDPALGNSKITGLDSPRIRQRRHCFFERHPVLSEVQRRLVVVPFELTEDNRGHDTDDTRPSRSLQSQTPNRECWSGGLIFASDELRRCPSLSGCLSTRRFALKRQTTSPRIKSSAHELIEPCCVLVFPIKAEASPSVDRQTERRYRGVRADASHPDSARHADWSERLADHVDGASVRPHAG